MTKSSETRGRSSIRWGAGAEPHARIPDWVLDADVSDRAVRLYAVLGRYADAEGHAFPGKTKLMNRLRGVSRSTLDATIAELTKIDALEVNPRFRDDGGRTSNDYLVLWLPPADQPEGVLPPVGEAPSYQPEGLYARASKGLNENQGNEGGLSPPGVAVFAAQGERDLVEDIYAHWKIARSKPRARLTENRRVKIRARLREGFSVDDLIRAIDGVAFDPWPGRAQHDDLTVILRNPEQVERFVGFHEERPQREGGLSGAEAAAVARSELERIS